jgi:hypothetical protein
MASQSADVRTSRPRMVAHKKTRSSALSTGADRSCPSHEASTSSSCPRSSRTVKRMRAVVPLSRCWIATSMLLALQAESSPPAPARRRRSVGLGGRRHATCALPGRDCRFITPWPELARPSLARGAVAVTGAGGPVPREPTSAGLASSTRGSVAAGSRLQARRTPRHARGQGRHIRSVILGLAPLGLAKGQSTPCLPLVGSYSLLLCLTDFRELEPRTCHVR